MDGVHIPHLQFAISSLNFVLILVVMDGVHILSLRPKQVLKLLSVLILVVMDGVHILLRKPKSAKT